MSSCTRILTSSTRYYPSTTVTTFYTTSCYRSSSSSSSGGWVVFPISIIIGIVIAILVVLSLFGICIYVCIKRSRRRRGTPPTFYASEARAYGQQPPMATPPQTDKAEYPPPTGVPTPPPQAYNNNYPSFTTPVIQTDPTPYAGVPSPSPPPQAPYGGYPSQGLVAPPYDNQLQSTPPGIAPMAGTGYPGYEVGPGPGPGPGATGGYLHNSISYSTPPR